MVRKDKLACTRRVQHGETSSYPVHIKYTEATYRPPLPGGPREFILADGCLCLRDRRNCPAFLRDYYFNTNALRAVAVVCGARLLLVARRSVTGDGGGGTFNISPSDNIEFSLSKQGGKTTAQDERENRAAAVQSGEKCLLALGSLFLALFLTSYYYCDNTSINISDDDADATSNAMGDSSL
eukprot:scaffold2215_cov191-Alexandrium_tamarense.AAC.1